MNFTLIGSFFFSFSTECKDLLSISFTLCPLIISGLTGPLSDTIIYYIKT